MSAHYNHHSTDIQHECTLSHPFLLHCLFYYTVSLVTLNRHSSVSSCLVQSYVIIRENSVLNEMSSLTLQPRKKYFAPSVAHSSLLFLQNEAKTTRKHLYNNKNMRHIRTMNRNIPQKNILLLVL